MLQHESFEQALQREIREELGITVDIIALLSTFHFYRGREKAEHVGVRFLCRLKSGTPTVDGIEEIAAQWLPLTKAIALVKDESIVQTLTQAATYVQSSGSTT